MSLQQRLSWLKPNLPRNIQDETSKMYEVKVFTILLSAASFLYAFVTSFNEGFKQVGVVLVVCGVGVASVIACVTLMEKPTWKAYLSKQTSIAILQFFMIGIGLAASLIFDFEKISRYASFGLSMVAIYFMILIISNEISAGISTFLLGLVPGLASNLPSWNVPVGLVSWVIVGVIHAYGSWYNMKIKLLKKAKKIAAAAAANRATSGASLAASGT